MVSGGHLLLLTLLINFFKSTESEIKTEEQDETSIDMYDDEFHFIMEKDFASTAENVNEVSENEDSENDSDATEIDDEDYEAVSGEWAVAGFILILLCNTFLFCRVSAS